MGRATVLSLGNSRGPLANLPATTIPSEREPEHFLPLLKSLPWIPFHSEQEAGLRDGFPQAGLRCFSEYHGGEMGCKQVRSQGPGMPLAAGQRA